MDADVQRCKVLHRRWLLWPTGLTQLVHMSGFDVSECVRAHVSRDTRTNTYWDTLAKTCGHFVAPGGMHRQAQHLGEYELV